MNYESLTPNLGVKSVNETVKFYTEFLGFEKIVSVPESGELVFAIVSAGNVNLMFQQIDNLKEEYPKLNDYKGNSAFTLYVKLQNTNVLYEKIRYSDYLIKEMYITPYGAEEFAIRDNNGFILTMTEDKTDDIKLKNYDNFFFPVDDFQASKKFYAETLGLKIKFELAEQGMIAFAVGNEEPAIILKDKEKFPNAKPTVWIAVTDVLAIFNELKDKEVHFLSEPFKIRTGWAVEFIDSSGNTLGFTDYLSE